MQTAASAASSTSKPSSLRHGHERCTGLLQYFHEPKTATCIRRRAAAADAVATTIRPADIQPVQCLKEWAPVCAALGDGLQTVGQIICLSRPSYPGPAIYPSIMCDLSARHHSTLPAAQLHPTSQQTCTLLPKRQRTVANSRSWH
jgi:hypothetical protein